MLESSAWVQSANACASAIRKRVLAHTIKNKGGYLSQACSAAESLATLYTRVLNIGPSEGPTEPPLFGGVPGPGVPAQTGSSYNGPRAPHLDRFIFSPVHYALVLYSTLIEVGRLSERALDHFNVDGSTVELIGAEHSPGHEVTAGSLGQAISQAGGIALARKLRGDTGKVWVYMSDGEFQEGQTWEAFSALAYHKIDNLRVLVDVNGQCCDGDMSTVMNIEPLADRLRAFGASVAEVDGHKVEALAEAALAESNAPRVILARTCPWQGMDIMKARSPFLHYVRFKSEAEERSYINLLEHWGE